jgi:hypothetical protein
MTKTTHRISWFVWAGGEKIRYQSTMRGTWGFDASCTCGWDSQTGGATETSVQRDVDNHKMDARLAGDDVVGRINTYFRSAR